MQRSNILSIFIVTLLLSATLAAYAFRQTISDTILLALYEPPEEIAQLADDAGLSDEGRKLFYIAAPELLLEAQFDQYCVFEELGLVLGCYDGTNIYLLDVTEERLEPVEPVTAAHEMLHVVYARMSHEEREYINALLDEQIENVSNQRILDEVESYRSDPNADIYNELHSILGSEYPNLSDELEAHYAKYFTDRQLVLEKSRQYESVFNQIKEKIENYDKQLASIRNQIIADEEAVAFLKDQITTERAVLDLLKSQNNVDEYNARIPGFNALVDSHNALVRDIQNLVSQYNQLVVERNENVFEQNDLIKSLDSDVETI